MPRSGSPPPYLCARRRAWADPTRRPAVRLRRTDGRVMRGPDVSRDCEELRNPIRPFFCVGGVQPLKGFLTCFFRNCKCGRYKRRVDSFRTKRTTSCRGWVTRGTLHMPRTQTIHIFRFTCTRVVPLFVRSHAENTTTRSYTNTRVQIMFARLASFTLHLTSGIRTLLRIELQHHHVALQ